MNLTKTCSKCHETKPLSEFYKDKSAKNGKRADCKECNNKQSKKYRQEHREENLKKQKEWYEKTGRKRQGSISMYENKNCSNYLGIVIGERLCRYLFKNVKVMPRGNTGYDIICNKGKKIDVKSGCICFKERKRPHWQFKINHNTIADFFILVAFDNRTDLNPLHLWMIPGHILNKQSSAKISLSTIHKWDKYKQDIKDAQLCCTKLKNGK